MTALIGPEKHGNAKEAEIKRKMDKGEGRDWEQRKRRGQGVEEVRGREGEACVPCGYFPLPRIIPSAPVTD